MLLEERVNLDSNNSSNPPSSNGPGKLNRAQRRASDHKRGAQPGHKSHSRAMLDETEVDRLVDCKPDAVCECGGQVELDGQPQRHQVFEVPPMRAQVDEYRLYVLIATVKKELQLDASLYTCLQILSVSVFETTQISCAL